MDLDVLKKDWQKTKSEHYKFNGTDFSLTNHKKSISIGKSVTKRLFVFSILEFFFWGIMGVGFQIYFKDYELQSFTELRALIFLERINYLVLTGFILFFLTTYKSININDSIKILTQRILKTKKIVNYYIYYNIFIFIITFLIGFTWELFNNDDISKVLQNKEEFIYVGLIIFGTILASVFGIFIYKSYTYIYGKLINDCDKLYTNLNELN